MIPTVYTLLKEGVTIITLWACLSHQDTMEPSEPLVLYNHSRAAEKA